VSYTDNDGDSRVDEYAMRAADGGRNVVADPSSRSEVLALDQPYPNHNGGHIVFGPDGMLYVGFGDGGSGGDPQRRGQDPFSWLGKLLRIDPRPDGDRPYTVPPDNPYADGSGALPEIWSAGLRNPWRFSFDADTGDLWVGDVGQNAFEEIDLVPAAEGAGRGTNFGWSAFEGSTRFNADQGAPDHWLPIYEYHHGDSGCSVTGGVVYRGAAIPALRGAHLFGDYCAGGITALVAEGGRLVGTTRLADEPAQVVSFGTDADGEVYVLSLGGGVYRLDPA
jgi:glucose/arabinose dehydrogenase